MRITYRATGKVSTAATTWWSPVVKVEVAEPYEEDADQR
jgi:hypothetical protein